MDAERLAAAIREHQPCVVLTGAGVSTESGIPDFRSPTGIWAEFDPLEYGSIDAFRADPEKVWRFYAPRFSMLTDARPNDAHRALAELERRGLLRAVVTQNIDLLHERAGSRDVIEVHGSIEWSRCMQCGGRVSLERVAAMLEARPGAPECEACIAPLKPDVVLFGELLPEHAMFEAHRLATEADLMIAIGSSLEVYPVAGLPQIAAEHGAKLALVTQGPTPYDREAEVKLSGDVVDELEAVLAAL